MENLTPRRIVAELDRYIIGQEDAKRAVAVAVRNRWRRQQLEGQMRQDVLPKNIILIGPTGVGKTEIARRLASLVRAPFLKVEATKYTEVGYHGRDVESMIRDLVELAVNMVTKECQEEVHSRAEELAAGRLLSALLPFTTGEPSDPGAEARRRRTRERIRVKLDAGELDGREVVVSVEEKAKPMVEIFSNAGVEQMGLDFQDLFDRMNPSREVQKKMTVAEARRYFAEQAAQSLIDRDKVKREAIARTENSGIVFVDELDKIVFPLSPGSGPDVSRGGVQRDLLPIVEGSTVATRYGSVRTDHILFMAAGSFHSSKPSDLIPELQGRFPIRVELTELGRHEFVRILKEPENALIKQYRALLRTEGVAVEFLDEAVEAIAEIAEVVNQRGQDIGARRLHTVLEKLLDEVLFDAPDLEDKEILVDAEYVRVKLRRIADDEERSRYIL